MNIVTGERIQQLCNIYFGFQEDFDFNPIIKQQSDKHFNLNNFNTEIENSYYVFCYSHRINDLSDKIHLLKNKFVLVTHNSDGEVIECSDVLHILNTKNLEKWYAQNVCFQHPKLNFIPIGIANSMWNHGNLNIFKNEKIIENSNNKSKNIYFNFNIDTNKNKRSICFDSLKKKLEWLNNVSPEENILRLSEYKFSICPEGNGCDTHRLWEALYVKTIPIVISSYFTTILEKNGIPIIIIDTWDDFDETKLIYNTSLFENVNYQKIINFLPDYL